jgi:hypothetical protein
MARRASRKMISLSEKQPEKIASKAGEASIE